MPVDDRVWSAVRQIQVQETADLLLNRSPYLCDGNIRCSFWPACIAVVTTLISALCSYCCNLQMVSSAPPHKRPGDLRAPLPISNITSRTDPSGPLRDEADSWCRVILLYVDCRPRLSKNVVLSLLELIDPRQAVWSVVDSLPPRLAFVRTWKRVSHRNEDGPALTFLPPHPK